MTQTKWRRLNVKMKFQPNERTNEWCKFFGVFFICLALTYPQHLNGNLGLFLVLLTLDIRTCRNLLAVATIFLMSIHLNLQCEEIENVDHWCRLICPRSVYVSHVCVSRKPVGEMIWFVFWVWLKVKGVTIVD